MKTRTLKGDLMMLLAALIWGTTFLAQRAGMRYMGPFAFNSLRFFLGAGMVVFYKRLVEKKKFCF